MANASPWAKIRDDAAADAATPPPPSVWAPMDAGQPALAAMPKIAPDAPPKVVYAPTPEQAQIDQGEQRLQKLNWQDKNPWGTPENHPGKMGKLAHVFSTIGNIAGDVFAPGVMMNVPGTQMNRAVQENGLVKQLAFERGQQSQNEERGAQTAEAEERTKEMPDEAAAREKLEGSQAANIDSETAARQNPSLVIHDTDAGPLLINPKTGAAQHIDLDGQPVGPKLKLTQSQPIIGPDGKPHTYMLDEKGNKVVDLGQHYERPVTVNVNPGEKTWEYANNQLNTMGKPISDLTMRMGRLQDTLAQNTPQADALIAPELMTVMAGGQGSGLRMNEAEISRVVGGRSNWEALKAAMNKWSLDPEAANSITPDQRKQIRALVNTVASKLTAKQNVINDAANQLVDVSDAGQQHRILAQTRQKLQAIDEGKEGNPDSPPPGADVKVPGKDGKMYWGNSKTKEIIGPA